MTHFQKRPVQFGDIINTKKSRIGENIENTMNTQINSISHPNLINIPLIATDNISSSSSVGTTQFQSEFITKLSNSNLIYLVGAPENDTTKKSSNNIDLTKSDLKILLKNFYKLDGNEQHILISHLKELENKKPEFVNDLTRYVKVSSPEPENIDERSECDFNDLDELDDILEESNHLNESIDYFDETRDKKTLEITEQTTIVSIKSVEKSLLNSNIEIIDLTRDSKHSSRNISQNTEENFVASDNDEKQKNIINLLAQLPNIEELINNDKKEAKTAIISNEISTTQKKIDENEKNLNDNLMNLDNANSKEISKDIETKTDIFGESSRKVICNIENSKQGLKVFSQEEQGKNNAEKTKEIDQKQNQVFSDELEVVSTMKLPNKTVIGKKLSEIESITDTEIRNNTEHENIQKSFAKKFAIIDDKTFKNKVENIEKSVVNNKPNTNNTEQMSSLKKNFSDENKNTESYKLSEIQKNKDACYKKITSFSYDEYKNSLPGLRKYYPSRNEQYYSKVFYYMRKRNEKLLDDLSLRGSNRQKNYCKTYMQASQNFPRKFHEINNFRPLSRNSRFLKLENIETSNKEDEGKNWKEFKDMSENNLMKIESKIKIDSCENIEINNVNKNFKTEKNMENHSKKTKNPTNDERFIPIIEENETETYKIEIKKSETNKPNENHFEKKSVNNEDLAKISENSEKLTNFENGSFKLPTKEQTFEKLPTINKIFEELSDFDKVAKKPVDKLFGKENPNKISCTGKVSEHSVSKEVIRELTYTASALEEIENIENKSKLQISDNTSDKTEFSEKFSKNNENIGNIPGSKKISTDIDNIPGISEKPEAIKSAPIASYKELNRRKMSLKAKVSFRNKRFWNESLVHRNYLEETRKREYFCNSISSYSDRLPYNYDNYISFDDNLNRNHNFDVCYDNSVDNHDVLRNIHDFRRFWSDRYRSYQ